MIEWALTFHYDIMKLQSTDNILKSKLSNYLLARRKEESR